MVLQAGDALALTTATIARNDNADLQVEVGLAESAIRAASGVGLLRTTYNATIIGNPGVDPRVHTDIKPQQLAFYNLFVLAGFNVGLDTQSDKWLFSWDSDSAEVLVSIYTFRVNFDPSAIIATTTTAIESFFFAVRPIISCTVTYNGNLDETGFGGTASEFWEFTIVVDQGESLVNHSSNLKTYLTQQGLGYLVNNCGVYMLVI